ncbi:MAG: twin-arginine translocation signal domain-containing protein, partial [Candidatus Dojkabacteria bacterium]|nr:twin-arginine translocation signal domain-containing protein [Candidatus Dojkabacteria bacterium]
MTGHAPTLIHTGFIFSLITINEMGSDDRIHDHEAQTLPPSLLLKLSRRQFLQIGALMAASLALPGCRPSTTPGSTPAFPSLTIVPLLTPALQPTKTADNTLPPATVPFGQSNSSTDSPTAAPQTPAPPGITPDTNPSVSSSPQPERQRPRWGYFTGGPDIAEEVQTVQDAIGAVPDFLTTFVGWHGEGQIPEAVIETARAHKQTVIVFWEVYTPGVFPSEDSAFSCNEILSGRYDEYLEQFAQTAGRAGVPILLIPIPEPNGEWTPQCIVRNGNSAESFRSAFKHTASFFENSPNVRVGLAMNSNSVPDPVTAPENAISEYVLGSGAEFVGIDG